jgi:molybdenum cofactor biosynthesis enzyme MoaA
MAHEKTSPLILCPMPWVNMSVYADGSARFCCFEEAKGGINLAYNNPGGKREDLSLADTSIMAVFNSDSFKQTRLDFLRGIIPPSCKKCIDEEKKGIYSRRLYSQTYYPFAEEIVRSNTGTDGSVKKPPISLDIRFNTRCNLNCRMCGPHYSSKWKEEYSNMKKALPFVHDFPVFTSSVADNPRFREQLRDVVPGLKSIYMTGGEAMLIKEHWEFIDFLIDNHLSENLYLNCNINLTYLPDYAPDKWSCFKGVSLGLSLDGVGKRCEYIRYGLRWKDVLTNLEKLQQCNSTKIRLITQPTITWLNLYYIDELYNFMFSRGLDQFFLNFVYVPEYFSIWHLPHMVKQNTLRKLRASLPGKDYTLIEKQVLKTTGNVNILKKGILLNQYLDKQRNESFHHTFPELSSLLKGIIKEASL